MGQSLDVDDYLIVIMEFGYPPNMEQLIHCANLGLNTNLGAIFVQYHSTLSFICLFSPVLLFLLGVLVYVLLYL